MSKSRERLGHWAHLRGERLMSTRTRLVLTDDHPIVLHGLENLFRLEPDFRMVVAASTARKFSSPCAATSPRS